MHIHGSFRFFFAGEFCFIFASTFPTTSPYISLSEHDFESVEMTFGLVMQLFDGRLDDGFGVHPVDPIQFYEIFCEILMGILPWETCTSLLLQIAI